MRRTHPITIGSSFLNYNFHLLQWKQQQREVVVYQPVDRSLVAETHLVDELDPGEDVPDAYYYVDALAGSHPLNKLDNFLPNLFPAIRPWSFSGSCFYELFSQYVQMYDIICHMVLPAKLLQKFCYHF